MNFHHLGHRPDHGISSGCINMPSQSNETTPLQETCCVKPSESKLTAWTSFQYLFEILLLSKTRPHLYRLVPVGNLHSLHHRVSCQANLLQLVACSFDWGSNTATDHPVQQFMKQIRIRTQAADALPGIIPSGEASTLFLLGITQDKHAVSTNSIICTCIISALIDHCGNCSIPQNAEMTYRPHTINISLLRGK